MSTTVTKTPQARQDLLDLADYIARDSLDTAERFLGAAEAAVHLLASMPTMGTLCEFRSPEDVARIVSSYSSPVQNEPSPSPILSPASTSRKGRGKIAPGFNLGKKGQDWAYRRRTRRGHQCRSNNAWNSRRNSLEYEQVSRSVLSGALLIASGVWKSMMRFPSRTTRTWTLPGSMGIE